MNFEQISTNKFIFSHSYREGVNDALSEIIGYQRKLLKDEKVQLNCAKIFDEIVNSMYERILKLTENLWIEDERFWQLILSIITRSYLKKYKRNGPCKIWRNILTINYQRLLWMI